MTVATEALNQLAFHRRVRRLWRLGPRPVGELLLELAAISGRRTWLDQRLEDYANLDGAAIDAVGARDWPAPPLHVITGRRT